MKDLRRTGLGLATAAMATAVMLLVGVAALVPGAMARKEAEYRLAGELATSGLEPLGQAALIAAVYHRSRFGPEHRELDLDAALAVLEDLTPELAKRLALPQTADDERTSNELAVVLATTALFEGPDLLLPSLERGALRREIEASAGREAKDGIPALLWQLAAEEDWQRYAVSERELLDEVRGIWAMTRIYRHVLPRLQSREKPTAIEYALAVKDAIVYRTGAAKWLLHLLLGGLAFFAAYAFLQRRGLSRRRAGRLAFAGTAMLALAVELADWIEAVLNDRFVSFVGSVADAVVTCLIAMVFLALSRRRARARPRDPRDEPAC